MYDAGHPKTYTPDVCSFSPQIQTLAQQVQELTAQLSLTTDQHQATMRATQEHFMQQLAASKQQMR